MAQQDVGAVTRNGSSVNDKVAKAKSVLSDANRRFPGMGHAPVPAAKPATGTATAKVSAKPASEGEDVGTGLKWNISQAKAVAPKMHKGGPVKADGVYSLKRGEHVLTEPEARQAQKHALMASGMNSLAKRSGNLTTVKDPKSGKPKGENNSVTVEPLPASAIPKPKFGLPTDNRARQMKPGEDIKTT